MNAYAITYTESFAPAASAASATQAAKPLGISKSESQLLTRLRQGDERAFNELVDKNHAAMIRMAMGYVADRDVAEEVVQDTWMAVIDGVQRFEGRSSLRTWVFGILIHKAKDRGVREARHITFSDLESYDDERDEAVDPSRFHLAGDVAGNWAFPPQPWDEVTPERLLASKQALEALNNAIEDLPRGLREALVLRDVEGLESQDICEALKITESSLYVRLHRARERVRRAIDTALTGHRRTM